jgi:hypothetical protein
LNLSKNKNFLIKKQVTIDLQKDAKLAKPMKASFRKPLASTISLIKPLPVH